MAYKLKSQREIELMRQAGRVVHQVLVRLTEMAEAGVTTAELDAEAERMCLEAGGSCLFKGVPGKGGPFPGAICCSINEQVVHGIPGDRKIADGDVVSVDFGVRLKGYCGDSATTFAVGSVDSQRQKLMDVTRETLQIAVDEVRPGRRWSEVAGKMQKHVEDAGFGVVRQFVGHGIGAEMWEEPKVPNYVSQELLRRDIELVPGLVLAIEPMVTMGSPAVRMEADGWTVVTNDRKPAAHFEHMLAITADGVDVLTDGS